MLDLETLSTRPNAVILTIGAVKFDPFGGEVNTEKGLYYRINVDEQIAIDRHVMESTVEWWGKQAEEVREEALGDTDRVSLEEFTAGLNRFLVGV